MSKPTLMILAAGMGSRYGGLKQMDGFGASGAAIIEYSIYDAIRAGFGKVVFIIREHFADAFKARFAGKFEDKIEVVYAFQEFHTPIKGIESVPVREKPWGTGHAMLAGEAVTTEPFLVINADDYYGMKAFEQMADFLMNRCTPDNYSLVAYQLPKTLSDNGSVARGVCDVDDAGNLTGMNERTKILRADDGVIYYYEGDDRTVLPENTVVSMNYWGFHPSVFERFRTQFRRFLVDNADSPKAEFFIPLPVNDLIQRNIVEFEVMTSVDKWHGVTYREDKEVVEAAFVALHELGLYPEELW